MTERLAADGGAPVRDEFLVFGSPAIGQAEIDEVASSMRSGWVGSGPKVARFEEEFRAYLGVRHAVAVNSCTAALHLSMLVAGVGEGDEVITSPLTFAATANAVIHCGARPVFVDVDPRTQNIDPQLVARAITPRTRAILPVHFAGHPCDMAELLALAEAHDLLLISDAAHCIEGRYRGEPVGAMGDASCFSFYVTKNITTIEGGMLVTDDEEWAGRVKSLSLHGLTDDAWSRYSDRGYRHYQVVAPGFKYNMTDVQASLGLHQLPRIEAWHRRRREIWASYDEALADLPVTRPTLPDEPGTEHALHLYTLLVDVDDVAASRDEILEALHAENVGAGVHYLGLHLHPYYQEALGAREVDFPHSSDISTRTLSIPLSAKLTDRDVDDVVAAVRKVLLAYAK